MWKINVNSIAATGLRSKTRAQRNIRLDEISSDISLNNLRLKLSIISQELTLFNRTNTENIAYGDNGRHVPIDEIFEAAENSFAMDSKQIFEDK